ncbi:hypothetical protein K445DRAFT_379306 [Daldinia sp. EC12]|nr:hypothetical protein K445DRAFT_379306 [Daldinia sp. EC12]
MGRGNNFRRGGHSRRSRPHFRNSGPLEYDDSQEDVDDLNEDYAYPNTMDYNGYNYNYPTQTRSLPGTRSRLFSTQPPPLDGSQRPFQFVHQNRRQNRQQAQGQQSQGQQGTIHYHHHNHYYHNPNSTSPFPTQTATGQDNDVMMVDYSAINTLENRLSVLGAEIREFLLAMAGQNDHARQFVEAFVGFLNHSKPDSELLRVLITPDNPQENAMQPPPVVPPVVPVPAQPPVQPVVPPIAPPQDPCTGFNPLRPNPGTQGSQSSSGTGGSSNSKGASTAGGGGFQHRRSVS